MSQWEIHKAGRQVHNADGEINNFINIIIITIISIINKTQDERTRGGARNWLGKMKTWFEKKMC